MLTVARMLPRLVGLALITICLHATASAAVSLPKRFSRVVVKSGENLVLDAAASGVAPLTYRWTKNGLPLPGTPHGPRLAQAGLTLRDAARYAVEVTDATGDMKRAVFFVAVHAPRSEVWMLKPGEVTVTRVPERAPVVDVSSGVAFSLVLKGDGTVTAWLEDVNRSIAHVPTGDAIFYYGQHKVPAGLRDVVAIAAGRSICLALKADGTVTGWGGNGWGSSFRPISVPADLADVVDVAVSWHHALALKADGTVVGFEKAEVPPDLRGVAAIAAGGSDKPHFLALKTDGTVVGWGDNSSGQINVPANLRDVVAIYAGAGSSLARRSDGTLVAWGRGAGALPPDLEAMVGAIAAGLGQGFGVAVKETGEFVSWGGVGKEKKRFLSRSNIRGIARLAPGFGHMVVLNDPLLPR